MFNFFKKKKKQKSSIALVDLNGNPLQEGDLVEALRYDLGTAKLIKEEDLYMYESSETGQRVSYLKMIDAVTTYQKVKKLS